MRRPPTPGLFDRIERAALIAQLEDKRAAAAAIGPNGKPRNPYLVRVMTMQLERLRRLDH